MKMVRADASHSWRLALTIHKRCINTIRFPSITLSEDVRLQIIYVHERTHCG
jgi:hypothetical protein